MRSRSPEMWRSVDHLYFLWKYRGSTGLKISGELLLSTIFLLKLKVKICTHMHIVHYTKLASMTASTAKLCPHSFNLIMLFASCCANQGCVAPSWRVVPHRRGNACTPTDERYYTRITTSNWPTSFSFDLGLSPFPRRSVWHDKLPVVWPQDTLGLCVWTQVTTEIEKERKTSCA